MNAVSYTHRDSAVAGNKAAIIGGCVSHSNLVTEYKYGVPSIGLSLIHICSNAYTLLQIYQRKSRKASMYKKFYALSNERVMEICYPWK